MKPYRNTVVGSYPRSTTVADAEEAHSQPGGSG